MEKRVLWQLVESHLVSEYVGTVLGNVGHGTSGCLRMLVGMDLEPVASVTVLLTETWYFLDL